MDTQLVRVLRVAYLHLQPSVYVALSRWDPATARTITRMIRNYLIIIQARRRIWPQYTTGTDLHANTQHRHCPSQTLHIHTQNTCWLQRGPATSSSARAVDPEPSCLRKHLSLSPFYCIAKPTLFFLLSRVLLLHLSFSLVHSLLCCLAWPVRAASYLWMGWHQALAASRRTNPRPAGVLCVWSFFIRSPFLRGTCFYKRFLFP